MFGKSLDDHWHIAHHITTRPQELWCSRRPTLGCPSTADLEVTVVRNRTSIIGTLGRSRWLAASSSSWKSLDHPSQMRELNDGLRWTVVSSLGNCTRITQEVSRRFCDLHNLNDPPAGLPYSIRLVLCLFDALDALSNDIVSRLCGANAPVDLNSGGQRMPI